MWKLIYNGECSKAKAAKDYLDEKGIEYTLFNYLEEPMTPEMLKEILMQLGLGIDGVIRMKEDAFKGISLQWFTLSDAEKIQFVVENPIVIERPIVIYDDCAVIARPDISPIDHLLAKAWKK